MQRDFSTIFLSCKKWTVQGVHLGGLPWKPKQLYEQVKLQAKMSRWEDLTKFKNQLIIRKKKLKNFIRLMSVFISDKDAAELYVHFLDQDNPKS